MHSNLSPSEDATSSTKPNEKIDSSFLSLHHIDVHSMRVPRILEFCFEFVLELVEKQFRIVLRGKYSRWWAAGDVTSALRSALRFGGKGPPPPPNGMAATVGREVVTDLDCWVLVACLRGPWAVVPDLG